MKHNQAFSCDSLCISSLRFGSHPPQEESDHCLHNGSEAKQVFLGEMLRIPKCEMAVAEARMRPEM